MFSVSKKVLAATVVVISMGSMVQADGKADYMASGCAGCHGVSGISAAPIWPNLAGQKAAYTVKQLKDFQSGVRKDAAMQAMAVAAKGKEQAIADWLAKQ